MLYFSRWDSPQAARDFAKLYADYLPKRYKKAVLKPVTATNGKAATAEDLTLFSFETNEGKATLEVKGNDLLILEGFDDKVAEKARDVLLFGMTLPETAGKSSK